MHIFVTKVCTKALLLQRCISTAMVYFHKYFTSLQIEGSGKELKEDSDKYSLAIACVLVSSKTCDQLIPIKKLTDCAYVELFNLKLPNIKEILDLDKIFKFEFFILQSFNFDLTVDLPYKYLMSMKPYFNEYLQNSVKLYQVCYFYINDSFKLPICLFYNPLYIALACVYLIFINFKVNLTDTKDGKKWFNLIAENVSLSDIKTLSLEINNMYSLFGKCSSNNVNNTNSNQNKNSNFNINLILSCIQGEASKITNSNYNSSDNFNIDSNREPMIAISNASNS